MLKPSTRNFGNLQLCLAFPGPLYFAGISREDYQKTSLVFVIQSREYFAPRNLGLGLDPFMLASGIGDETLYIKGLDVAFFWSPKLKNNFEFTF